MNMINVKAFNDIHQLSKIAVFEEIDSTNKTGISLAKAGMHDFLIISEEQTEGRGRFKRKWLSPRGGAYFSLGLNAYSIEKPQLLTFVCAKAVMDMLNGFDIEPEFKWPNDVLIKGLKISGILIELIEKTAICGIGINVNNSINACKSKAISMKLIRDREFLIENIIVRTVSRIYSILDDSNILMQFIDNNPMRGRSVTINTVSGMYKGTVEGLSGDGAIIINTDSGLMEFFEGDLSLEYR